MFDRLEQAKVEADKLRTLYPALDFKTVDKRWGMEPIMQGEWFGTRML